VAHTAETMTCETYKLTFILNVLQSGF